MAPTVPITGNVPGNWNADLAGSPVPPNNVIVQTDFLLPGSVSIRWDDPSILAKNSTFGVLGVNLYRSDISDRGPYYRINEFPLSGGFFRDRTDVIYVQQEVVAWDTAWRHKGDAPNNRMWVFQTSNPICKNDYRGPFGQPVYGDTPFDVLVEIDGVEVPVDFVFGRTGEVRLVNQPTFDDGTERYYPFPVPSPTAHVTVSYYRYASFLKSGLDLKTFYRATTVATDPTDPTSYLETPLVYSAPANKYNVEQLDYIWREAVRRNHWILQQGGERVKLFIRKTGGVPCSCTLDPVDLEYNQQPLNSCLVCFGTSFQGGFEGPFDIIIAPDDAPSKIAQTDRGYHKEKTQDLWMTATPLISQRDFILKMTGERFSVGAVHRPTARGMILQQHFNIAYLDESDIRYKIPVDGVDEMLRAQTRVAQWPIPYKPEDNETSYIGINYRPVDPPHPEGPESRWPEVTEKSNIDDSREGRGRTAVWENITY